MGVWGARSHSLFLVLHGSPTGWFVQTAVGRYTSWPLRCEPFCVSPKIRGKPGQASWGRDLFVRGQRGPAPSEALQAWLGTWALRVGTSALLGFLLLVSSQSLGNGQSVPPGRASVRDKNEMTLGDSALGKGRVLGAALSVLFERTGLHCGSPGSCRLPSLFLNSCVCVCVYFLCPWWGETVIGFLLINPVPGGPFPGREGGLASCLTASLSWPLP